MPTVSSPAITLTSGVGAKFGALLSNAAAATRFASANSDSWRTMFPPLGVAEDV
jgi:hypothetical protein